MFYIFTQINKAGDLYVYKTINAVMLNIHFYLFSYKKTVTKTFARWWLRQKTSLFVSNRKLNTEQGNIRLV